MPWSAFPGPVFIRPYHFSSERREKVAPVAKTESWGPPQTGVGHISTDLERNQPVSDGGQDSQE